MLHLDLFSGIGGFSAAAGQHGFRTVAFCETDRFARKVIAARFPGVPCLEDIRAVTAESLRGVGGERPSLVTFGFPCQDLSVAGKRAGLAGGRSGLFWEAVRLVGLTRPAWFVAENVPGLLSSNGGRDMAACVGAFGDLGYLGAWRVFDAQYFGVAQRRRRVFFVGCLGRERLAALLPFLTSGFGDPAPRRAEREVASAISGSGAGTARTGNERTEAMMLVVQCDQQSSNGSNLHADRAPALDGHSRLAVAFQENIRAEVRLTEVAGSLNSGGGKPGQGYPAAQIGNTVRRLSPTECERLQGLPDGWSCLCGRNQGRSWPPEDACRCADGPRYRALGNGLALPCVAWIMRLIREAEEALT